MLKLTSVRFLGKRPFFGRSCIFWTNTRFDTRRPAGLIIRFAAAVLGSICQQLYTMVDTAIVGQALGAKRAGFRGAADWLNWMVLGIITGFADGFAILGFPPVRRER